MKDRVNRWKEAWESRDADRVAALYAEDATHMSSVVAQVRPELGRSELRGREEIRDYARIGVARFDTLRFEILNVIAEGDLLAVEYHRHSNLDVTGPKHVLELFEWPPEGIRAVRVFHG